METSERPATSGLPEQERFGPYVVMDRLGVGGMATVHRAKQIGLEGLERLVALKRLLPHLAEDESFVRGFVREAKLASLLHHSNIAQIYELGRIDDVYYIAMELVGGLDVRRMLQHSARAGGPPPLQVTLSLLLQLCDALEHAHSAVDDQGQPLGIVHRDISPSNLLVTHSGHLKVIDFGIARAQSSQLATKTGRVKGKFGYMAPEIFAGGHVDHRADLFALGVVAHELLIARPLFTAKNEYQTILNVQQKDAVVPSSVNPLVPPELDDVLARAVSKDPAERWSSGAELGDALNDICKANGLRANHRDVSGWFQQSGIAAASRRPRAGTVSGSRSVSQIGSASYGSISFTADAAPPDSRSYSRSEVPQPGATPPPTPGARAASAGLRPATAPPPPPHSATAAGSGRGRAASVSDAGALSVSEAPPAPTGPAQRAETAAPPPPAAPVSPAPAPPATRSRTQTGREATAAATVSRAGTGTSLPTPKKREWRRPLIIAAIAANLVVGGLLLSAWLTAPPTGAANEAAVRVEVVPADAVVIFDNTEPHAAGEFSLEAGPHIIEIRRGGYRSYVSSLQLSPGGNETLRVVLEEVKDDSARLRVHVADAGELRVDGLAVAAGESVRLDPGPHSIEVWAQGEMVWSRTLDAEPGTNYDFTPGIEVAPVRRSRRVPRQRIRPSTETELAVPTTEPVREARDALAELRDERAEAAEALVPAMNKSPAAPPLPAAELDGTRVAAAQVPPIAAPDAALPTPPASPAPQAPPPQARQAAPADDNRVVNISESWVERRSGAVPRLTMRSADSFRGKRVAAKLCIDERGRVTSVKVLAKFPDDARRTLESSLRSWQYTPYVDRGRARRACFGVSFILAGD